MIPWAKTEEATFKVINYQEGVIDEQDNHYSTNSFAGFISYPA